MAPTLRTHVRNSTGHSVSVTGGQNKRKPEADQSVKPRKRVATRAAIPAENTSKSHARNTENSALPTTIPLNPQATFLGLPAELRLEIYRYVFDSGLVHVHRRCANEEDNEEDNADGQPLAPEFTWTPCRAPNPDCSLLCLNPKWSGLCAESERCTYRPYGPADQQPVGFMALSHTCRFVRTESFDYLLRNTTVSIYADDVRQWISYMKNKAPGQLALIRRVTVTSPKRVRSIRDAFRSIRKEILNLEAVGLQGQLSKNGRDGSGLGSRMDPLTTWRRSPLIHFASEFDVKVTVAMEGFVWEKRCIHRETVHDQHTVFRIIRVGKESGDTMTSSAQLASWENKDFVMTTHTSTPIERKRTAQWRKWWRQKEFKNFM